MRSNFIFAASLVVACAAFADSTTITTDSVIGVMPVKTTKEQVILSIPWSESVDGVAVTNLVKTAGLNYDATLTWYNTSDGGKYAHWHLSDADADGVRYWVPRTGATEEEVFTVAADNAVIKRGDALVLTGTNSTSTSIFYVVGPVGATSSITTAVERATIQAEKVVPSYTLLAFPGATGEAVNANSLQFIDPEDPEADPVDNRDRIIVDFVGSQPAEFVRRVVEISKGTSARRWVSVYDQTNASSAMIPAGRGFWYKRYGTGKMSVVWSAPAN